MQNAHPNICHKSLDGVFGSKFVSAVITGQDNNIQFFAKHVSNQAMALTRDQVIAASASDLTKLKVRKNNDKRIVPDVMFAENNEYNKEVVSKASPYFPREFLVIPVPSGFGASNEVFRANFPVENRLDKGQSLADLKEIISKNRSNISDVLLDFHLLIFFAKTAGLSVTKNLIEKIQQKDNKYLQDYFDDYLKSAPSSTPSKPSQSTPQANSLSPDLSLKQKDSVRQLVDMGFSESKVKEALTATGFNVEQATEILLSQLN